MAQKGVSLLEILMVVFLIGLFSLGTSFSIKQIEKIKFHTFAHQVKLTMHAAQQHAYLENKRVRITTYKRLPSYKQYFSVTVQGKYYYTIEVPENMEMGIGSLNHSSGLKELSFYGDMSPSQAGTVTLTHLDLGQEVKITLRPVTGKLTLYSE